MFSNIGIRLSGCMQDFFFAPGQKYKSCLAAVLCLHRAGWVKQAAFVNYKFILLIKGCGKTTCKICRTEGRFCSRFLNSCKWANICLKCLTAAGLVAENATWIVRCGKNSRIKELILNVLPVFQQ